MNYIAVVAILILTTTGCGQTSTGASRQPAFDFAVKMDGDVDGVGRVTVFQHRPSGKCFLFVDRPYKAGLVEVPISMCGN